MTHLGDLSLIRGISSIPSRVLQHITKDNTRSRGLIITHANEGLVDLVLRGNGLELRERFTKMGDTDGEGKKVAISDNDKVDFDDDDDDYLRLTLGRLQDDILI